MELQNTYYKTRKHAIFAIDINEYFNYTHYTTENNMSNNTIDTKITELFGVLSKKKEEVAEAEKTSKQKWKTNCAFPSVFGNTQPINIQSQSESALIELLADLLIHQEYQRKATIMLGSNTAQIQWGGFPIEDWIEDFKTRVAKIQLQDKKKELAQLEKRLDAIVSPEQRRLMELEAITKQLEG